MKLLQVATLSGSKQLEARAGGQALVYVLALLFRTAGLLLQLVKDSGACPQTSSPAQGVSHSHHLLFAPFKGELDSECCASDSGSPGPERFTATAQV